MAEQDPERKAALAGLQRGSKEYQKALDKFNADKARNQADIELRKAKIESDAKAAEAQRTREAEDAAAKRQRENEAAQADIARQKQAADEAHAAQTSMVTAGSVAAGGAGGLGGGYIADKYGTAKAASTLAARAEGARNLAQAARDIDPNQIGARARYAAIGQAADTSGVLKPRVVPYGGLGMAAGLGAMGAYSNFDRAPNAKSDTERAVWTGTGYGEMGAGLKMLVSSANRYANPPGQLPPEALADIEFARQQGAGKAPLGGYERPQVPQIGANGEATPPGEQGAVKLPNRERLVNAAKAAGATGQLSKADAVKWLTRRVTDDNRAAVAEALGVKAGDDFGSRVKMAVKDMAKTRGRSGIVLPLAMGAMAYDAMRTPSKAGGADPSGIGDYMRDRVGEMTPHGPSEVGRYIGDRIDDTGGTLTKFDDIYDDYVRYTAEKGGKALPRTAFLRAMRDEGKGVMRMAGANRIEGGLKTASELPSRGTALAAGAGAAGLTAGTQYAISKLPEMVGRAITAGGPGGAPAFVDSMTDYSPEDLAQGRNMAARYLPSWARGGAIEDAYQMAQVPERNPMQGDGFDSALNEVISHLGQGQEQ